MEEEAAAAAEPVMEVVVEPTEPQVLSLAEACQRFGLPPYVLRGLLDEYSEWLTVEDGVLPPEGVERLGNILRWRAQGLAPDSIRARLAGGGEDLPEGEALVDVLDRLAQLQGEVTRGEERRVQDRDRLLTTLVRTQQEIQHLRYELVQGRSRRDRRKGFWQRLFGG